MTKRILVTGAGGFIGRHLMAALEATGAEIMTAGSGEDGGRHCRIGDATSAAEWERLLREFRPHRIYHLAGTSRARSVAEFYQVNAGWAAALLDAVERSLPTATVLLMGSAAEYGRKTPDQMPLQEAISADPDSHYAISKHTQTLLGLAAARRGLRVVVPRAFNVVGPGMPGHLALADFAQQIVEIERGHRPRVLTVGNLDTFRDFVDVRDVVSALLDLAASEAGLGRVVNLCSGQPTRMLDLVRLLIATSECDITVEVDPARTVPTDIPVSYGSGRLLEALTGRHLVFDAPGICADILDNARRHSGE